MCNIEYYLLILMATILEIQNNVVMNLGKKENVVFHFITLICIYF